jgi:hypothetical protein
MKIIYRFTLVLLLSLSIILVHSCKKDNDNSIIDGDGNVYTSVKIDTREWLVENLKTTRYMDGTAITLVTDNTAWSNLSISGYCWYNTLAEPQRGSDQ